MIIVVLVQLCCLFYHIQYLKIVSRMTRKSGTRPDTSSVFLVAKIFIFRCFYLNATFPFLVKVLGKLNLTILSSHYLAHMQKSRAIGSNFTLSSFLNICAQRHLSQLKNRGSIILIVMGKSKALQIVSSSCQWLQTAQSAGFVQVCRCSSGLETVKKVQLVLDCSCIAIGSF